MATYFIYHRVYLRFSDPFERYTSHGDIALSSSDIDLVTFRPAKDEFDNHFRIVATDATLQRMESAASSSSDPTVIQVMQQAKLRSSILDKDRNGQAHWISVLAVNGGVSDPYLYSSIFRQQLIAAWPSFRSQSKHEFDGTRVFSKWWRSSPVDGLIEAADRDIWGTATDDEQPELGRSTFVCAWVGDDAHIAANFSTKSQPARSHFEMPQLGWTVQAKRHTVCVAIRETDLSTGKLLEIGRMVGATHTLISIHNTGEVAFSYMLRELLTDCRNDKQIALSRKLGMLLRKRQVEQLSILEAMQEKYRAYHDEVYSYPEWQDSERRFDVGLTRLLEAAASQEAAITAHRSNVLQFAAIAITALALIEVLLKMHTFLGLGSSIPEQLWTGGSVAAVAIFLAMLLAVQRRGHRGN